MKIAVIGTRSLTVKDLSLYMPINTTEIVSGGAKGIDTCARNYALEHNIKLVEFLPNYARYKKGAPLKRNLQIIEYADYVIAFWDGISRGTYSLLNECLRLKKPHKVYLKMDLEEYVDLDKMQEYCIRNKIYVPPEILE